MYSRAIDRVSSSLARVWPSLFAYQFLVEARRLDSVEDLLTRTVGKVESSGQLVGESV